METGFSAFAHYLVVRMCERKSRGKPWLRSRAWINGSIEHRECSGGVFLHHLSLVIPNDPLGTEEVAIQG